MELEMQWDGNPNIVLDINTRVGVALPIQVMQSLILCSFLTDSTSEMLIQFAALIASI